MEVMIKKRELKSATRWRSGARAWSQYAQPPRIYVSPQDETVIEQFVNRRDRPIALYKKIAKKALKNLGIEVGLLTWSQKAGCSCGCSPGLIVRPELGEHGKYCDMFVSFNGQDVLEVEKDKFL